MADARTRVYRKGVLEAENFPVADVSEYIAEPETLVWIDFCAPTHEQISELADELGLHELAVEDAIAEHQRPKLDHYATHLFLSCHAVKVNLDEGELQVSELDAFISRRWLVTVRREDGFPIDAVLQRWDASADLAVHGAAFLVYGLLDIVVDGYFGASETFDEYYDGVAEGIFSEHPIEPSKARDWFQMRQALVRFHRLVVPMREAVSSLMRREHDTVSEELYPYYQDVYDHILRVSETTDSLRDLVSSIVETNLSLRDYRQNVVMKKVTSWAAIIAVPTLITGFYGMNVPYPGFAKHWGYTTALVAMVVVSLSLYLMFRHKEWL